MTHGRAPYSNLNAIASGPMVSQDVEWARPAFAFKREEAGGRQAGPIHPLFP